MYIATEVAASRPSDFPMCCPESGFQSKHQECTKQRKCHSPALTLSCGCGQTRTLPWWPRTAGWCSVFSFVIVSLLLFVPKINANNDNTVWKEFWNFVCAYAFQHSFEAALSSCGIVAKVFFLRGSSGMHKNLQHKGAARRRKKALAPD